MNTATDLPWFAWLALAVLLVSQGTWLFVDARRRGARGAWAWGLLGLVSCPTPSLLYWWFVVRPVRAAASAPPPP